MNVEKNEVAKLIISNLIEVIISEFINVVFYNLKSSCYLFGVFKYSHNLRIYMQIILKILGIFYITEGLF